VPACLPACTSLPCYFLGLCLVARKPGFHCYVRGIPPRDPRHLVFEVILEARYLVSVTWMVVICFVQFDHSWREVGKAGERDPTRLRSAPSCCRSRRTEARVPMNSRTAPQCDARSLPEVYILILHGLAALFVQREDR